MAELTPPASSHSPLRRIAASYGKWLVIGLPLLWLFVFFLVPLLEMAQVSFTEARRGIPPFKPLWGFDEDGFFTNFNFENYGLIIEYADDYIGPAINSVRIAFFATLICLLFAYPMAYWIARTDERTRLILLILVLLPFWTSSLLRMYALIGLLNPNGFVNAVLMWLGIIENPIKLMQTEFSVYMGMLLTYLPLMILPLYATLTRLDQTLNEAAADLGANSFTIFTTITLPLSLPGIIAGCLLVFIPAVGEFVIPALLGGPDQLMLGKVLWTEFFRNRDWPVASAIALILMVIVTGPIIYMRHVDRLGDETGEEGA